MATPEEVKQEFNDTSQMWQVRYQLAVDNQQKMFSRFAKWYDLMYAAINTKDYAPWRSKVYIPILASKAWGMMAKLQALNPGFEVGLYGDTAENENAQDMAEKAQWKIEHDWNNPEFDEPMQDKLFAPLTDALVCGTGLAKVHWCIDEKEVKSRPELVDGYVDPTEEKVKTKKYGYNDVEPVNIFNVFIAPNATNLYSAGWVIIKDFKTFDDLEASGIYNKKDLAAVKDMRAKSDDFAQQKKSRNRLTTDQDPIASDNTLDHIEIFECYERATNTISTFVTGQSGGANNSKSQWIKIRSIINPYWHGKYPLVVFYTRKRPFDFWGQGIFEDTERMQNAVMDVFNHFLDSYNLSVNGMIMKPETETTNYQVGPGQEMTYRSTPPQQFKFADPNPNILTSVINTMEAAIEDATISSYSLGTPDSATDNTSGTATGIRSLQQAAGDKIGFFKSNYRTALRTIGNMWLSNNQQFMTTPMVVDGMVNSRPAPVKVSPSDLQAEMVLRVNDASMEPISKQEQLQQFIAYTDRLEQIRQASFAQAQISGGTIKPIMIDYGQLVEELSDKFSQKNYDKIVMSEQDVAEKTAQAEPKQPEQPQAPPPKQPSESLSYKDATPFTKAQIEAQAGLQPDPIHQLEEEALKAQYSGAANLQPQAQPNQQVTPEADHQVMQDAISMANEGSMNPTALTHMAANGLPMEAVHDIGTQATDQQPQAQGGEIGSDGAVNNPSLMDRIRGLVGRK